MKIVEKIGTHLIIEGIPQEDVNIDADGYGITIRIKQVK